MEQWLYFGCHQQPGHYLFFPGMRQTYDRKFDKLRYFDGKLPPQDDQTGYIASVSRLGGWGMSALAFWDYTVDKRGGCNSVFFAPSLTISPEDLMAGAKERFPQVWARLPEVVLHPTAIGAKEGE